MLSVIYEFVDKTWQDYISISDDAYFQRDMKANTCHQLVRYIWLEHSEDDREYYKWLSQDELYFALTQYMKNNEDMVFYPN